jgi:thiamine-monophosphate kinase
MDISDGLAVDLHKLCASSGCGAEVDLLALPLEMGLRDHAPAGETAHQCALNGGEDQVLLFSAPPSAQEALARSPCPVFRVGHLTGPEEGLTFRTADGALMPLEATGYDHFAP